MNVVFLSLNFPAASTSLSTADQVGIACSGVSLPAIPPLKPTREAGCTLREAKEILQDVCGHMFEAVGNDDRYEAE